MKHTKLAKMLAAGAVCAIALGTACAQDTSTTTTTTGSTGVSTTSTSTLSGSGTIITRPASDYITFRTETSTEPVKYYYSKSTTVVDPEGRIVEISALRPDMPVTYTYVKEGDRMVVTKVTLQKPLSYYEKKETTTTTTTP
jgi:hypothetical protein